MLATGSRIGAYEVIGLLGSGGMGEVYRARDTRLKRDVALKVLPASFAADPARLARFRREAEVLATLDDPHLARIHGLEEDGGVTALVLQLVEGETLADRIARGPIPPDEVLTIAGQIARGVAAAHAQGIVHRDLKPSNIVISPVGGVKVLDFGLAKLAEPVGADDSNLSLSPTITSPAVLTGVGAFLGTAAYMSPEQAKGKQADKRSDVWAFGAVVYEMLTGQRAHKGETVSETIAAVLKEEPDLAPVPRRFRRLLRSCLQKDPESRLHDIADWRLLLDDDALPAGDNARGRTSWLWPAIAVAVLVVAAVAIAFVVLRRPPTTADEVRMQVPQPEGLTFNPGTQAAISPDAKWIAFAALGADNITRMYIRSLSSLEVKPLPGSEGIIPLSPPPFWSYDSRYVVYGALGKLKKSEITGTPAQTIADTGIPFVQGGTWNEQGTIVFARNTGRLEKVSADGGTPVPVTKLGTGEVAHRLPQFLPDGRRFLYLLVTTDQGRSGVYVGSLDATPESQPKRQVVATNRQAWWVRSPATGRTFLLIQRDDALMAQPFDTTTASLSGAPVLVANGVGAYAAATAGLWSIAATGALVYRGGGSGLPELTWVDLAGKSMGTVGTPGDFGAPVLSPDGKNAAFRQADAQGNRSIWIQDLERSAQRKLTFDGREDGPVWSADGRRIFYSAVRGGRADLYEKNADGTGEERVLLRSEQDKFANSASPDGKFLLFTSRDPKTDQDLWLLPLDGTDKQPVAFVRTPDPEGNGQVSPDQRWIAYMTQRSGTPEIIVRPFPDVSKPAVQNDGRWLVTSNAIQPRWRRDGKRLHFVALNGELQFVDVDAGPTWQTNAVQRSFTGMAPTGWSLSPNADRILMARPSGSSGPPPPFTLVLNWMNRLDQ